MATSVYSNVPSHGERPVHSFANSLEHISAELQRIDLLAQLSVRRARELASDNDLQRFCITEQELDSELAKPCGLPPWAEPDRSDERAVHKASLARVQNVVAERRKATLVQGVRLRLEELAALCTLTPFEAGFEQKCGLAATLLKLQRTQGNRYVQRALAQAQQRRDETEPLPWFEYGIKCAVGNGRMLDAAVALSFVRGIVFQSF